MVMDAGPNCAEHEEQLKMTAVITTALPRCPMFDDARILGNTDEADQIFRQWVGR